MLRTIGSVGALTLLVSSATAQLIVGNDQSGTASIYYIDVGTGAATAIYSASDSSAKPWGMAYDPGSNTLYWNNGSNLYSSPFDINGLTPTLLGGMTFNGSTVNFVGLGFRNGLLVGTRNITTEAVYEIDPFNLTAAQTYIYSSTYDFGGVDVDATDDALYGLSDSGGSGLYLIDDTADTVAFKAPYPAGETDIDGLAVYNGLAYYVTDGPNSSQVNFYIYDIATGTQIGTLRSPFTGSGTFAAAAFVPAPGALGLLGLGAVAAIRRRR
jgi:MYXO-CTERM domain-containing protein